MDRAEKLKRCGIGIILIGFLGRLIHFLCVDADSDFYSEIGIACVLMVLIGYGIRIWADRRREKADSRKSDSKADKN